jgi:hypothetical protein
MQIDEHERIWSIADEDLERTTEEKTSAVHFLRFEITDDMAQDLKTGAGWKLGVQHPVYSYEVSVDGDTRQSLLKDLD